MIDQIKNIFDITARSLSAQQVRLNTIASNIANAHTKVGDPAKAYRPLKPVFESVMSDKQGEDGLATVDVSKIVALNRAPTKIYEPANPAADKDGFVYESPVNQEEELIEMLDASRAYQNNLEVISTMRTLMVRTIDIGK
ncbi:MAG: flagellar basal body rod protein FlgC [Alphaproteobacteria bacterium]